MYRLFFTGEFSRKCLLAMMVFAPGVMAQDWVQVFDGTTTNGLVTVGADAHLQVNNGVLVGTGTCPKDKNGNQVCGYFATAKSYSHYKMKLEFKLDNGNSGFVWHVDKWIPGCRLPSGIELNINTGGQKDIWWTDVGFKSTGTSGFVDGGPIVSKGGKFGCNDHANYPSTVAASLGATVWNALEVYVNGDSMEAKLNDKVWMRVFQLKSAPNVPMTQGKVGFYLEGTTMNVRNWQMIDLANTSTVSPMENPAPDAVAAADRRPALRLNAAGNALEIVRPGAVYDLRGNRLRASSNP